MDWLMETFVLRELIRPMLDIGIIAFIIYSIYSVLDETRAIQLIKGAVIIVVVYAVALILRLNTLLMIIQKFGPNIFIALAIVFQPELRKIFTRIGQQDIFRFRNQAKPYQLDAVLSSVEVLAEHRRGALLVFARNVGLKNIIDTGTLLNADLNSSLIISVFGHDTPLHDGAMVIQQGRITAAGCFLPLSRQTYIRKSFGTRHRAALGLVEETDAIVVVVSEESGAISLAVDSNILYDITIRELSRNLRRLLNVKAERTDEEASLE